jgi:uncharacterized membrane protein (UPF0127 family)
VLVSFSLGQPYSLTAATGAVVLLLIGRVRTERILEGVDWTLLAFFAGLFVVMHGVEESGLAGAAIKWIGDLSILSPVGQIAGLSLVSVVLSNVVSNVPAVMLLKPLTLSLGGGKFIWLALAMSSTLAGNLTLIGSVANLIVAQQAKRKVDIGFMEYFRVGALITAITVAIGILVLVVEVKIGNGAELPVVTGQIDQKSVIVRSSGQKALERTLRVALFCDTEDLRTKGLQGFRRLAADEAALFVFEDLVEVTFWMGSVDFPIDIIFVGQDRKVVKVYQNCRPGSLDLYPSGGPVLWVIETAAGSGIRAGDRVQISGQGSGVKGQGKE